MPVQRWQGAPGLPTSRGIALVPSLAAVLNLNQGDTISKGLGENLIPPGPSLILIPDIRVPDATTEYP